MERQFNVRYGRNYKIVLSIILPTLFIIPFLFLMQNFPNLEEWKIWLIIVVLLGVIISISIWLALHIYPEAQLSIRDNQFSITFDKSNIIRPADFSFSITDIISFKTEKIQGVEYYLFVIQHPGHTFQLSPSSFNYDDLFTFYEAMEEINEKVNRVKGHREDWVE